MTTYTDNKGYVWVTAPDGHHKAMHKGPKRRHRGYVKRCWLVVEEVLGRPIQKGESVHHINGIKCDDRPENLEVVTHSDHSRMHVADGTSGRRRIGAPGQGEPCSRCQDTIRHQPKRGLCNACYLRAKRDRRSTGEWPEYAKQFATLTGRL